MTTETRRMLLIGVAGVSAAAGVVGNNAWTAWMGELVPAPIRGRHFGQRAAICAAAGSLAGLAFGVILDRSATCVAPSMLAVTAGLAGGRSLSRRRSGPC